MSKHLNTKLVILAAVMLGAASARAQTTIFTESFETPEVPDSDSGSVPTGWGKVGHPSYVKMVTETNNAHGFTTPFGTQGVKTYSSGWLTTDATGLSSNVVSGATYTLTVRVGKSSGSIGEYKAMILAFNGAAESTIASLAGDSDTTVDMSYEISFSDIARGHGGERLAVRLLQDPNRSNWQNTPLWDNVILTETLDTTPPTLAAANITHNVGASMEVYNPVTYTLTFSEEMDPSSITAGDFSNIASGPSTIAVDSITQTDTNIFEIVVTPTSTGSLQLRVSSNVTDWAGLTLAANVDDAETITVGADSTAPQVVSITDNCNGGPVAVNSPITYTVTFNEYIDEATVGVSDFVNASSAPITVDSVSTGALPNVFTVIMTPAQVGDIVLRVSSGSIEDKSGNASDQNWDDSTTITVLDPRLVVYEPFADSDSTLPGNTPGTGLTGTWSGNNGTTISVNLVYGDLITGENGVQEYGGWRNNEVSIDASQNYSALLANGGEMWFSAIYRPVWANGSFGTFGRFAMGIGDDGFISNGDLATSSAQAIGFGVGGGKLFAGVWTNSNWGGNNLTAAPATADDPNQYLSMSTATTYLVVGRVQWGTNDAADADIVTIYAPGTDLAQGAAVAQSRGITSQASFSLIATHNGNNMDSAWDEIRIGASYADVVPAAGSGSVFRFK